MIAMNPLLFLPAIVIVPIGLIVLVVLLRAKSRREALRGPWSELARRLGGQFVEGSGFTGSSINADRPTHNLQVKMTLVSVMDAASCAYYPDGGTFTEVIVGRAPNQSTRFVPQGTRTQTFVDHTEIPALAHLGEHAKIYLDPTEARIVLPGVSDNLTYLDAAAQSLEGMVAMVMASGPLPAAA